jgi:4-amino-4-deoxy-L-arabinose transferase-like glycosyltransferase
MKRKKIWWFFFAVFLIFLYVLFLFPAVYFGLPHFFSADEPFLIEDCLDMIDKNDLNPHSFYYGGFTYYLLYGVFKVRGALFKDEGRIRGYFIEGFVERPERQLRGVDYYRTGRIIILSFAAFLLFSFFLFGARAYGVLPSFIALLILLFNPLVAKMAVHANPDVPMMCFLILSFIFGLSLLKEGKSTACFLAGLFCGLAVGTKLSALPFLASLILALILRRRGRFISRLLLLFCGAALGFLLVNPAALFDRAAFWQGTLMMSRVSSPKLVPNITSYLLSMYENLGWAGLVLISLSLFLVIKRREKLGFFLFSFIFFYLVSMSLGKWFYFRYTFSLIPVFYLLIGNAVVSIAHLVRDKLRLSSKLAFFIVVPVVVLPFALQFLITVSSVNQLKKPLAVAEAKMWLEENAKPGAFIAREYYTPYIDPVKFRVYFLHRLINRPPAWYLRMNFDYLLVSSENYNRLFPERYRSFLSRCETIREFSPGFSPLFGRNPAVLVVKPVQLPDDRLLLEQNRYLIFEGRKTFILDIGGDDEIYLGRGFSGSEREGARSFRWSVGRSSSLFFPLEKSRSIKVVLTGKPFLYSGVSAQVIELRINGRRLGEISLSRASFSTYRFIIPTGYTKSGVNELYLGYGHAASPAEVVAGSGDLRVIAVAYDSVEFIVLNQGDKNDEENNINN